MKLKLHHPLWVHLPAVILFIILLAIIWHARALLGSNVPLHFGISGMPEKSPGSTWEAVVAIIVSALVFIGISIAVDEDWARRESRKTFNWMSLLDECAVGFLAAFAVSYFSMLHTRIYDLTFPWPYLLAFCGGGMVLAVILEYFRPWNPAEEAALENVQTLAEDVHARIASGQRWVYTETQNPPWLSVLVIGVGALVIAEAIDNWSTKPEMAYLLLACGLAVFLLWGGLGISVTAEYVTVRLGLVGMRLLRMKVADIDDACCHEFSPLRNFGGYGIRFNREMTAFFFSGNRGVKLRAKNGRQFLIGSDHPERLTAVVCEAMGIYR